MRDQRKSLNNKSFKGQPNAFGRFAFALYSEIVSQMESAKLSVIEGLVWKKVGKTERG